MLILLAVELILELGNVDYTRLSQTPLTPFLPGFKDTVALCAKTDTGAVTQGRKLTPWVAPPCSLGGHLEAPSRKGRRSANY